MKHRIYIISPEIFDAKTLRDFEKDLNKGWRVYNRSTVGEYIVYILNKKPEPKIDKKPKE